MSGALGAFPGVAAARWARAECWLRPWLRTPLHAVVPARSTPCVQGGGGLDSGRGRRKLCQGQLLGARPSSRDLPPLLMEVPGLRTELGLVIRGWALPQGG